MSYEVVNEKLGIMSCCIEDLTAKQIDSFYAKLGENMKIETLAVFYDSEGQNVVLNRNNPQYDSYLQFTEAYLEADPESRVEAVKMLKSERLKSISEVLDVAIEERDCTKMMLILGKTPVSIFRYGLNGKIFKELIQKEPDRIWNMYQAFVYGVIQGKRAERKRRKEGKKS